MPDAGKLLTVTASGRSFALPVEGIIEIIRLRAISRVPHAPRSLIGVANFRNTALPVVSLARLLGTDGSRRGDDTRIVVFAAGSQTGLLVDSVGEISDRAEHEVLDAAALLARDFAQQSALGRSGSVANGPIDNGVGSAGLEERAGFICFEVAGQDYALPLNEIVSIAALPSDVTEVPRTDDAMAGVAQIRCELVSLVSLRVLLGLHSQSAPGKAHVVIVSLAGKPVGLIVDDMKSVLRVAPDALDPVPSVLMRGSGEAAIDALCRLEDGGLVSILSVGRLFDEETTRRLTSSVAPEGGQMPESKAGSGKASRQFVVFELGRERYGLPIAAVDEIVRRPDRLTRVPRAPAFVEGIMSLRGKTIPVIDQRQRFAVAGQANYAAARIIVLTVDGLQTGIAVDRVTEILSLAAEELKPAPEMNAPNTVVDSVAFGHGENMILMIEPKTLIDRAERDMLTALRNDDEGGRE